MPNANLPVGSAEWRDYILTGSGRPQIRTGKWTDLERFRFTLDLIANGDLSLDDIHKIAKCALGTGGK